MQYHTSDVTGAALAHGSALLAVNHSTRTHEVEEQAQNLIMINNTGHHVAGTVLNG